MCQPLAILVALPRVIESKISIIFCCIKACMNLNGIECIVEMDGKTLKKIKSLLLLKHGRNIPGED